MSEKNLSHTRQFSYVRSVTSILVPMETDLLKRCWIDSETTSPFPVGEWVSKHSMPRRERASWRMEQQLLCYYLCWSRVWILCHCCLWIAPASGNHEAWWRERREEVLPRRKNEECGTNKMSNLDEKCIGRKGVLRPTERHERQCLKYGAHDDMRIFCPSVLYKCTTQKSWRTPARRRAHRSMHSLKMQNDAKQRQRRNRGTIGNGPMEETGDRMDGRLQCKYKRENEEDCSLH